MGSEMCIRDRIESDSDSAGQNFLGAAGSTGSAGKGSQNGLDTIPGSQLGGIEVGGTNVAGSGSTSEEPEDVAPSTEVVETDTTETVVPTENDSTGSGLTATSYPLRQWTSNDGKKAILAFVRSDEKGLIFVNKNNDLRRVSIERFSAEDQAYLAKILAEQE